MADDKIFNKIVAWYKKRINKKQCVVCEFYSGVDDEDDSPTEYGVCFLSMNEEKHKYYDSCEKFKAKDLKYFL